MSTHGQHEIKIVQNDPHRPGRARVYLNNVEIASVLSSYAVYCEAGKRAMVTLDIPVRLLSADITAGADVGLTKRTRDALTALGWTPPAEREA
jgi:hypothetical protein